MKVWKFALDGFLVESIHNFRWKSTEELSFMTLKSDTKFGEESTCRLKLTRGIWKILTWALESLKYFPFNGLLLSKIYVFWAKTVQRSYLSWHWKVMQNLKGNWLVVSKLTWGIWQILTRALESLKNFHFNVLLLSKVYIVWAKKVQRSYLSWHWRVMQNFRGNWLAVSKLTWGICEILTRALKVSKIFILICSFWANYILFELKKYKGVIFHDTVEWCKIWVKTDLWFEKWHEEFGKFSPEHLDSFIQSRKCMSLKFAEELYVMTMKNDAKFGEELTCHFKIDMRNLTNFDSNTQKSKKFAL